MYTLAEALIFNYENRLGLITTGQVGNNNFKLWNNAVKKIYTAVKTIKDDRNFKRFNDSDFQTETNEIYSLVSELLGMIGMVNGFPLRRESHLAELFVAFASVGCRGNEQDVGTNTKSQTLFNLRIERYFARLIIEQSLKSSRLLEDEMEDLRAIRKVAAIRRKKRKKHTESNSTYAGSSDNIIKLVFTSIIARCNTYASHASHCIQKISASVDIVMPSGAIIQEELSLGYCAECNVYFILEYDYKRLRMLGVLLCQVVTDMNEFTSANIRNLKPESLLHQSGYNVNATSNLSAMQRHEILRRVIANKLYTPLDVISFLDWLIKCNSNTSTKNMDVALSKWYADRTFIIEEYINRN